MEASEGDTKYYYHPKSGEILQVKVLSAREKTYHVIPGEEYRLKILKVINIPEKIYHYPQPGL